MIYIAFFLFFVTALSVYGSIYFFFKTFLSKLLDDSSFVKEVSETISMMFLFFFFLVYLVIQYQQVVLGATTLKVF